ncbi:hypothetical protein [Hydrococcus rivularis]|nr:hypothetical protein [Hydrococcus rivularis]
MTQTVDRPHPLPLSLFGRGEKDVDRENLKIGIRLNLHLLLGWRHDRTLG